MKEEKKTPPRGKEGESKRWDEFIAKGTRGRLGIRPYFFLVVLAAFLITLLVSNVIVGLLEFFFQWQFVLTFQFYVLVCALVIGTTILAFLGNIVTYPIRRMSGAMRQVAKGDYSIKLSEDSSVLEFQDCARSFNIMTGELASNELLQSDFVSNVSHEFKTPLGAVSGYATLLKECEGMSEEALGYVEKIEYNTTRLSELVGNILLLSKIENQVIKTPFSLFSLDEQIRLSLLALEPKWTGKGILPEVELEEVEYYGNPSLLAHVFNNLIDNAVKFSHPGGTVSLGLCVRGEEAVFTITDGGVGMSEEQASHIFDKFYQADSSHTTEGNGLGLALCARIVDVHKGRIEVQSSKEGVDPLVPGGSTFTVYLPMHV